MTTATNVTPSHNLSPVPDPMPAFWSRDKDAFFDHRSTPDLPIHSDIVIIGAGYAGTSVAWHLVKDSNSFQKDRTITILEARGICEGATGRNGGHLRPDLYSHIPRVIERYGLEAAVELAQFEILHVSTLKRLIEKENINCDLVLARTVDVCTHPESAEQAKAVYELMSNYNVDFMKDVFFKYGPEAEQYCGVKGALSAASYTAATLWPFKLVTHLLKSLVASGDLNLQSHTPVTQVRRLDNGRLEVITSRGTVQTDKVVYANNAYVAGLLPEYAQSIIPCKGICCHIALPKDRLAPLLGNSYVTRDLEKTSAYLIPRTDGSIVAGGATAKFKPHLDQWYNNVDDRASISAAEGFFDGYMQRTFHGWNDTDAKVQKLWTGVMGYSYDTHAHVGPVPQKPDEYVLAGFNGHGMPVGWLAGKGLAKMIDSGVPFTETGIPRVFETSLERIKRAQNGSEAWGDIIGDGSLTGSGVNS